MKKRKMTLLQAIKLLRKKYDRYVSIHHEITIYKDGTLKKEYWLYLDKDIGVYTDTLEEGIDLLEKRKEKVENVER